MYLTLQYILEIVFSATLNPILYQLMSKKFRIAFKDTFGYCVPCFRNTMPEITYSNIVGGASSYKLSRTGSFYSNGSFRRSSINFEACTPTITRKNDLIDDSYKTDALTNNEMHKDDNDKWNTTKVIDDKQLSMENQTSPNSSECSVRNNKIEKSAFLSVPSFKF